jgi:flagellar motor switch protein FliG
VAEFLLSNMSKRMAETLREEIAERGRVRPRDAEAAQTGIVNAVRRLEAAGEISLVLPEEEEGGG